MRTSITILLLVLLGHSFAQDYNPSFQQEYFYGNLPSAKVEAMGRGDAAIGGSVSSIFFNSAGLGGIERQEVQVSTSAPFYVLENSNYYFAGYARRVIPWLVVGLSANSFATGETTFDVNIGGNRYPVTKGLTTNYALSVAGTPVKGLYIGLNFNLYRWKLFDDVNAATAFHMDGGLLYKLELPDLKKIRHYAQFGVSVNNITAGEITYEAPDGNQSTSPFPIIGRFAAAYFFGFDTNIPKAGKGPIDFVLNLEYQNTFNTEFRNSFIVGFESVLWKVLALRLGYFTQSIDDLGNEENKSRITDFTYGFGAIVPLNILTNDKVPLSIHFDYVSLKQPPYTESGRRNPNMRTFTLRVAWTLSNN
jgi:hypothetical protein